MTRVEELLRDAARALRALAKLSIRYAPDAPTPWCAVCLRGPIAGGPIPHANICPVGAAFAVAEDLERVPFALPGFSDRELAAIAMMRAIDQIVDKDNREVEARKPVGILYYWPPDSQSSVRVERNFITGNPVRHIEYEVPEHPWASEEGPLHPAAVTHEEAAAKGAAGL